MGSLHWVQFRSRERDNNIHWALVYKGTNQIMVEVFLSPIAEPYDNYKLRKKMGRLYDWYLTKNVLKLRI